MTKFIAYYNLCTIHDTKEFLGLSPDRVNTSIIATLGRNIAIVIKISTQKQIKSWSVLDKFSCKVVYDHKSQQYVGVFAHRFIRRWDESVTDINKCKKLKFHKNIADLVYDQYETVVVYADGTCESLSSAIQSRKEPAESKDQQMNMLAINAFMDPKIVTLPDGRKLLTYFQKNETDVIELVKMDLDSETLKPAGEAVRFSLRRGGQDVALSGYSVIECENSPALMTIWSDRRVFLLNLANNVDKGNCPGQFVSKFNELKVDAPLTILGLSKHCVAIYGGNTTQEGGSLLLYNTQFKVVKAKQFFKIFFNFSRLWSVGSTILLAIGQNLSVVTYQMSKELLSDLVGSQLSNDFSHTVEADFINEEEELEEHLGHCEVQNCSQKSLCEKEVKIKDLKLKFADGRTIPFRGITKFEKYFNSLVNRDLRVELLQAESTHDDIAINLMSNYFGTTFVTEEVQIIATQLEQVGASEHEITEKLLWILIQADLVEDIAACLRRYTSVSERILVKTLKYVLQDFKATTIEKVVENLTNNCEHMEVEVDLKSSKKCKFPNIDLLVESHNEGKRQVKTRSDLMNIILSCSFDVNTISPHIRKEINYEEVVTMLEYLYILITCKKTCLEERPDYPDTIDDDLRILRWFGVFLNTHFQKMSLSKDSRLQNILTNWQSVFVDYKRQLFELDSLSALLYNIVRMKRIKKDQTNSRWYSIEEVRLY